MKYFFRTLMLYYTVFCLVLGSIPFEGLLGHLQKGDIIDLLTQTHKNDIFLETTRELIEPKIPTAHANGATDAIMAYDTMIDSTSTPKFRLWNGSAWGSEQSASPLVGSEIYNMVLKYSPTRDEAILVALTNTGMIQSQIWNGTSWSDATTLSTVGNNVRGPNELSFFRGFDVEYEQISGDAIIVVSDTTADPDYYVWNGTTLSGPTNIDIPTILDIQYIELASRPGSDELAFITIDRAADIYGMRWTGSAWNNMTVTTAWETTGSSSLKSSIDVAFEKTSGDIMFAWGFATAATAHFRYRTYAGGTLSSVTNVTNANNGGVVNWLKLASNPTSGSDQIMIGLHDAGADLNTFLWSGTAWSAVHAEHSAATENAVVEMDFDIAFETHSSNPNDAWILWSNGATVSRKLWDGGTSTWGTATTMGDDNAGVLVNAHPNNGAVLAAVYEDDTSATDDIGEAHLTGGSQTWSTLAQIWDGPVKRNMGVIRMAQATQSYNSSNIAMLVYETGDSTSYPQYRRFDGTSWSSPASASGVNGDIRHMEIKTSPKRDESILVTLGSNGRVEAQVWNGTTGSWSSTTTLCTVSDLNNNRDMQSLYKGYDIEYENLSGDAIVVCSDGTADPNYYVWNGATWSGATDINIANTGITNYIELASRPGTDQIAMILLDANADVYGMRWTGSVWDNMGTSAVWETTASIGTKGAIDVAYEKTSGDIMFAWGFATVATAHFRYRTYSGTTLSSVTNVTNANNGGVVNWLQLAPNPTSGSDQMMIGVQDNGKDLNAFLWSGTAWGAVLSELDGNINSIEFRAFDIAYITHSLRPDRFFVTSASPGATAAYGNGVFAWQIGGYVGAGSRFPLLRAQPNTGAMFSLTYSTSQIDTNAVFDGGVRFASPATDVVVSSTPNMRLGTSISKTALASEQYISPTYTQQAYRLFKNANSHDVGAVIAAQDTAGSLSYSGDTFRLRALLRVDTNDILPNAQNFKLQFAQKSGACDIAFSGEAYADVTVASLISYSDNATPSDGSALTANANDPTDGGRTIVNQSYEELNSFTNNQASIANGQDGKWDFSLKDNGAPVSTDYCFRIIKANGDLLNTYAVIPQITTGVAGSVGADIVDSGGTPVVSPSVTMNSVVVTLGYQSATGIFGIANQKIRVTNTSGNPQWTLTLAADAGATAFWDGATDYDYNDPTVDAGDGADTDSLGGRMSLNPSSGTLAGTCSATGVTKGSMASFSEGVTDSITFLTAGLSANTGCYWDFTGVDISQTIPGEKSSGAYSINMTLTVTAI